jgi:hypothetical protein
VGVFRDIKADLEELYYLSFGRIPGPVDEYKAPTNDEHSTTNEHSNTHEHSNSNKHSTTDENSTTDREENSTTDGNSDADSPEVAGTSFDMEVTEGEDMFLE